MWPVLAFAVMAVARWGASFSPPLFFISLAGCGRVWFDRYERMKPAALYTVLVLASNLLLEETVVTPGEFQHCRGQAVLRDTTKYDTCLPHNICSMLLPGLPGCWSKSARVFQMGEDTIPNSCGPETPLIFGWVS